MKFFRSFEFPHTATHQHLGKQYWKNLLSSWFYVIIEELSFISFRGHICCCINPKEQEEDQQNDHFLSCKNFKDYNPGKQPWDIKFMIVGVSIVFCCNCNLSAFVQADYFVMHNFVPQRLPITKKGYDKVICCRRRLKKVMVLIRSTISVFSVAFWCAKNVIVFIIKSAVSCNFILSEKLNIE